MMKRSSSTIPFGYKLKEDNTLEPIEKELSVLKEMKDGVKAGAFSLRGAVEILESQTGFFIILGIKQILKINLSYCIFPQFIHTRIN